MYWTISYPSITGTVTQVFPIKYSQASSVTVPRIKKWYKIYKQVQFCFYHYKVFDDLVKKRECSAIYFIR